MLKSSQIHGEQNGACKGVEEGEKGELMFNGYRISVLQDEQSSEDGWGWCLDNSVSVLNATKLYI